MDEAAWKKLEDEVFNEPRRRIPLKDKKATNRKNCNPSRHFRFKYLGFIFIMTVTISSYWNMSTLTIHTYGRDEFLDGNVDDDVPEPIGLNSQIIHETAGDRKTTGRAKKNESRDGESSTDESVARARNSGAVSCPALIKKHEPGNDSEANKGMMFARHTTTSPSFWISLNNNEVDQDNWHIAEKGQFYDEKMTEVVKYCLQGKPADTMMIDVGGGIGWFSLAAASIGYTVATFETNFVNIVPFCQSLILNGWVGLEEGEGKDYGRVHVFPFGIGGTESDLQPIIRDVKALSAKPSGGAFAQNGNTDETNGGRMRTLDNMAREMRWIEEKTPIAILKIGARHFESFVIQGAKELLNSGQVENILMEFNRDAKGDREMLNLLMEAGYYLYKKASSSGMLMIHPTSYEGDLYDNLLKWSQENTSQSFNTWWKHITSPPL